MALVCWDSGEKFLFRVDEDDQVKRFIGGVSV